MLVTLIIFFLLLSALFSGTEIAFVSANKLLIELRKKKNASRGLTLSKFYDKPNDFLGTMLVGNNIALVVFTFLMSKLLAPYIEPYFSNEVLILFIITVLTTIVVLIFGEFLPKTLFRLYADEILYFLAYPLRLLKFLLWIPSWVMIQISNWVLRILFKAPIEENDYAFTRLDLQQFIQQTSRSDSEEEIDTELFEKALHLNSFRVRDCMVPRPEVEYIDVNSSLSELEQVFKTTSLSRIVVIEDDIDVVLGYVHHQQLWEDPSSIKKIILDLMVVPETMRIRDLLNKFIKDRISIACVVDEYGGTAGIITLEDILEEIFGEIEDEHDQEDFIEVQVSENEYLFSGRLEISYLNEKYEHLQFPDEDYHTLSGYLVMTTQEIPEQGGQIILDGYKFILELVSDTKIETIRVLKLPPVEDDI